jgi:hypothetical protein
LRRGTDNGLGANSLEGEQDFPFFHNVPFQFRCCRQIRVGLGSSVRWQCVT